MIAMVCGRQFVPFKATPKYLGNMISIAWLQKNEGRNGFPARICISERKTGYFKDELDSWLRHRKVKRARLKKAA